MLYSTTRCVDYPRVAFEGFALRHESEMNLKGMISRALILGCILALASGANAAVLAQYTFGTGAGTTASSDSNPDSSAGAFSALVNGAIDTGKGNPVDSFTATDFRATTGNYFTFTVTANVANGLSLTSISFDMLRPGNSDPSSWELRSSVDNFATAISTDTLTQSASVWNNEAATFDLQNQSSVTFRILGIGGSGSSSTLSIDNVVLNGTAVVPEPVNVALAIFGLAALGTLAGRRFVRRSSQA